MRLFEFTLSKNQWELVVSTADKHEVGHELVNLVKHAYNNTPDGSFVNSIKDVIPSDWNVVDWDKDPDVDACVFYRGARGNENWTGYKIQGLGHDGQPQSKQRAMQKVQELLQKDGWWIETSDAMRSVLFKAGEKAVTDPQVLQQLFNDPNLEMVDQITYVRTLTGGKSIRETVFGQPRLSNAVDHT
jgi:hypothetical protein